ncbi:MAG: Flagellar assembly factor FliW [Gemmatimonadaceae bacterium]|nr:Flagellar assembly factor FliW [Gemmatimonadaceae bacterium]
MSDSLGRLDSGLVNLSSEVLGTLPVLRGDLLEFPAGVPGFPAARTWALLPAPREGVYWLQSADYSALAFLLVDPFLYFPERYQVELSNAELARLGSPGLQDIIVLAIVTMPPHRGESCTANLQAPLLFNLRERQAFQSIRTDDGYSVREAFDLDLLASTAVAG